MKIQIICEACKVIDELTPSKRNGEVGIHSVEKNFRIGVSWKNEVIENFQEEFINELGKATSNKERRELLEDQITENAFSETIDFELSFTCKGCGNRITLNDFHLIDLIGF
ncbi:hypothetical protein HF394_19955 (plasmid) [Planococcus glaciei]|uniref:Uncharacterized protein n=1 Tax=Planococcus glaciei TaxID=459472 RepID=A0A518XS45_9BACL|nr:hypothetical protein [Planococcus glaciei]QDY46937.1 hypothetical protein FK545_20235 [Planococcus glaciei]QDY47018.1 hypothetical protein FK545_20820 [Planococcus glaciei]QKX52801.1 hypothetical protein HF394_19410 [Planococcus glaciei]QKX52903.1 hypothetical protein HF394_19955 [Planococcus glaciei]